MMSQHRQHHCGPPSLTSSAAPAPRPRLTHRNSTPALHLLSDCVQGEGVGQMQATPRHLTWSHSQFRVRTPSVSRSTQTECSTPAPLIDQDDGLNMDQLQQQPDSLLSAD